MTTTQRPALTLVHSDTTVTRTVTPEQAYRNLLSAIFEPTRYAPKAAPRHLTRV